MDMIKAFNRLSVLVREEIGYTQEDAEIIYKTATVYANDIFDSNHVSAAYIIGSYAAGTFTPSRSDIDFVAFYPKNQVVFFETSIPIQLCSNKISRRINVSVCLRPLINIDYWNTVPQKLRDGIIWKEINAYEDYMMILNHGIHIYGIDIKNELISLYEGYLNYIQFRGKIASQICKSEKIYPNLINVSKAIISLARDAIYAWTGEYYYSIYKCLKVFSEKHISDMGQEILQDAIDIVDLKWEEVIQDQNYEVPLTKIIRKCLKFSSCLRQYEKENLEDTVFADILDCYSYIPYNFPPCERAFERRVKAVVEADEVRNVELI